MFRSCPSEMLLFVLLPGTLLYTCLPGVHADLAAEKRAKVELYEDLHNRSTVRHRLSPTTPDGFVNVSVGIMFNRILEVIESQQSVVSGAFISLVWADEELSWSPDEFAGLQSAAMSPDSLWHPMVYITNSADENQVMLQHPPLLRVLHSGSVESHNTEFIKTSCRFDLSLFPFDTQHCDVMMVVMGGDVVIRPHVHFMLEHEPLYNFLSMPGEWSIEHKTVESKDTPGPVRFLALTLTLKRASLYYNLFLIAPLVVTSLVTPLVFWMPPGCGEKMSYLVALFLSNTVFFNFVGSILPRNVSEVPRLACFLSGTSVSCVVAMAATTLVLHRYQEEVDQLNVSSETGSNSLENKTVRPADGTTSTIKVLPVYKQEIDQLNVSFKGSNSVETVSLGSADCFVSTCSAEKRKQMKKEQDGLKCGEKEPKILEEAELETEDERRFRRRKNNTIVPEGKCLSRSKMVHYYACNDSWRLSAWALDKISFAIFCLINLSFYLWVFLNT